MIAGVVFCDQNQVSCVLSAGFVQMILTYIKLAPNDRFYPSLDARLIHFDCAKHIAMVSHSDSSPAALFGHLYKFFDPGKPIKQTVFSVNMQVDKFLHISVKLLCDFDKFVESVVEAAF